MSPLGFGTVRFSFLGFELVEQSIQSFEAFLPESAVILEPLAGFGEWFGADSAWPALRVSSARDQSGAFEHPQVLGYGGLTHGERFCEHHHRRFAGREPRQDGAPGRIGQRGKRCIESLRTFHLYNQMVV
jgi:hypothetical protein